MRIRIFSGLFLMTMGCAVLAQDAVVPAEVPVIDPAVVEQLHIDKALAAVDAGNVAVVQAEAKAVSNEVARLYLLACADRLSGNKEDAIRKAAKVVAFHYQDMEWLPRGELLCAELYQELGLTNAAAVTVRQIQQLYAGTDIAKKADAVRSGIESGSGVEPE